MEILQHKETETTTEEKTSGNSLDSLLAEYGEPATVTPSGNNNNTGNNGSEKTTVQSDTHNLPNNGNQVGNINTNGWQGNPLYYQTGKKAGQLRPKGPKVSYQPSQTPASISGELITGAMFLSLIDLMLPMLIIGIHNYFTKKKEDRLKWSEVSLTAEQRKQLSPVADQVVKQIVLTWNPTAILIFSMLGLYAMQYAIARMEKSLTNKEKK